MYHPLEGIPAAKRRAILWILALTTVLLLVVLGKLYGPLKNETAPQGIVSLSWRGARNAWVKCSRPGMKILECGLRSAWG